MKRFFQSLCLLATLALNPLRADDNLVQVAASNGQFKTLVSLLVVTGLDKALQTHSEFTVFAPTDEAFAKLPAETVADLMKPSGREMLTSILKAHVVAGERSIGEMKRPSDGKPIKTLEGTTFRLTGDGLNPKFGNAQVIQANVKASNGIIHIVSDVLMPGPKEANIVETAKSTGLFKTLLAALSAADLAGVFAGDAPYTVLAPTDEAFAKIPEATLASLLLPENKETLVGILKYHVISGSVSAKDAIGAASAKTLQGSSVRFQLQDGKLVVENATVIKNDVTASNGVIHVIDRVLMPPSKPITAKQVPVAIPAKKCPNQSHG